MGCHFTGDSISVISDFLIAEMEILIISIVALLASTLTFFSGFGLGTLLLPAFALFFPLELAIALTGFVHFANNIFKLVLVGRHSNWEVIKKFGLPAILFAFLGAGTMLLLSDIDALHTYTWRDTVYEISLIKLIIACLLIFFALMEVHPKVREVQFDKNKLALGGMLSGFFGGLSGHQGALRSAFLIRAGLSKEAFIATGVVIACLIDVSRLFVYFAHFKQQDFSENFLLLSVTTLAALAGALIGNKYLKKITYLTIQRIVAVLLFLIAIGLAAGTI